MGFVSKSLILLSVIVALCSAFQSLVTPFTTDPPHFATTQRKHPVTPSNYGTFLRPYKTNGWWTTLGIQDGSAYFSSLPYSVAASFGGMEVCSPKVTTVKGGVSSSCQGLQLGSTQNLGKAVITDFDDYLSVTVKFTALSQPECPGFSYFQGGVDLKGNDLFQVAGSAEDCCTPCAQRADCGGFTWYAGTCYMKTKITGSSTAYARVSATRSTNQKKAAPGTVTFPVVHGMPYVTAFYDNLTPQLTSDSTILSVNEKQTPATVTDSQFVLKLSGGNSWVLYSSVPITMNCTGNKLNTLSVFSGWIRLANIFQSSQASLSLLSQYKGAIPIGGSVDYGLSDTNSAVITFKWILDPSSTSQDLLMMSLPHHQDYLANAKFVNLSIYTSLGTMVGVVGNPWVLNENLPTISWTSPHGIIDCNQKDIIFQNLAKLEFYDPGAFAGHNNSIYWYDKGIWKLARLAVIADEFGAPDIASNMRATLKKRIEPMLLGQVDNPWIYEPVWGGILPNDALLSVWIDYGSGWYNDHHFHLGYMLYCIAVITKGDQQWGAKFKPQVVDLLRDISNPVADKYFPATRHLDLFVGHSWAGGVFSGSRNQESSSEAVNAYYGTYLYGLAVGDDHIMNVGRVLLATEIRGAQKYWHMKSSGTIYMEPFKDNKVVGIRWEDGANYGTFFGADPQEIHLIQMLPFSPISELLLPEDFIQEQFPVLEKTKTAGWEDLIAANQAIIDPKGAWTSSFTVTFGAGTTLPDTLYWVATRPSNGPGQICNKTYPSTPCTGSCCPNLIEVDSAGLSDGNYVYIKEDYRVILQTPERGFNLVELSTDTHKVINSATFDTYGDATASAKMATFVGNVPNGGVVLVGVQDSVNVPPDPQVISALQSLGAKQTGNISLRSSYALIGVKGGAALVENSSPTGKGPVKATYQFTC